MTSPRSQPRRGLVPFCRLGPDAGAGARRRRRQPAGATIRRGCRRSLATLLCAAATLAGCPSSEQPARPTTSAATPDERGRPETPHTIILISIDTLRADHLGLYGYERFTSPNLDAFARDGVVFEDASSTSPWTLPAHASLLTGRTPLRHGVTTVQTRLSEQVPTLASLLARAGYRTAAVVNSTWLKPTEFGLTREFDRVRFVPEDPARHATNVLVTDQAIEWLSEVGENKLFLFMHYYDVHADYASEPAYEQLFVGPYDGIANGTSWQLTRANLEDDYLEMCHERFDPEKCTFADTDGHNIVDRSVARIRFDADDVRHLEALYDAGIRQFDSELGRFFRFLDDADLTEGSVVVVTSDHGEEFMEHGRVDHFLTMYQEVIRVPFVLRGPGIPSGLRPVAPVSIIDVAPTLLTLAGLDVPPDVEGLDLSPLWRDSGSTAFEQRLLYGEASGGLTYRLVVGEYFPIYESVRQGRYKLVYDSKSGEPELFDLAVDPREQANVADAMPEIATRLDSAMRERRASSGDRQPVADPVVLPEEDVDRLRALGYVP